MKKVLVLLIALAFALAFASCKENSDKTPSGGTVSGNAISGAEEIGDISGDFNILVVGNQEWNDFSAEETDTALVDIAIYERNKLMESTYGVNIKTDEYMGFGIAMGSGTGFQKICNNVISGTPAHDAAMIGTYDVAMLVLNDMLLDLNETPHIDLSQPYWDQKANSDLSVNGKMYYTTGDISVVDNRSTHALFFNKEMIKDYGLENPHQLVKDNKWTLEKFGEMVKKIGIDNDNNGVYNKYDTFGLLSARDNNLAILAAAGEKICTISDSGEVTLTLMTPKVEDLYSKYLDIVSDHSHTFNWKFDYQNTSDGSDQATNEERINMFNNHQALFYFHMLSYTDYLREIETDFGILPFPKYNEAQEEYGHYISAWHSQFLCVPKLINSAERTGFVLETLAANSAPLTDAYYTKTLQGKGARDADSSAILDIIFDTRVYDIGVYYNVGEYKDSIGYILERGKSLPVFYEEKRPNAENLVKTINQVFSQSK
ncbi:MAG: extracellular solute-binding protein [Clostridia bacterium]|nr:extracellular solute-binding protein [Clostridia bacterium]